MSVNDSLFLSLQALKTNEQLKGKQIGTERALFREAFEQLRTEREADAQQIIDEVFIVLSVLLTVF